MRHPIEICLAAWEWAEDKRAQASAWKLRKRTEKKSFATFLSQGAVGGAFVYFLLALFVVVWYRDGYNFLIPMVYLVFFLAFGSVYGAMTALFVWLPGRLFKRRFRFLARAVFAMTGTSLLTIAFLYALDSPDYETALVWRLGLICGMGLAVALVTGSRIKPCRMLVFGTGRSGARSNVRRWLSVPVGFLLRAASALGLLEASMAVAVWTADRLGNGQFSALAEQQPAIAFFVLYFAVSSYLSIKTPRKAFLLPAAILLNLPLAAWIASPGPDEISHSLLVYVGKGFLCLWTLYTLGRLITPESASGAAHAGPTVVRLDFSRQRTNQLRSVQL